MECRRDLLSGKRLQNRKYENTNPERLPVQDITTRSRKGCALLTTWTCERSKKCLQHHLFVVDIRGYGAKAPTTCSARAHSPTINSSETSGPEENPLGRMYVCQRWDERPPHGIPTNIAVSPLWFSQSLRGLVRCAPPRPTYTNTIHIRYK